MRKFKIFLIGLFTLASLFSISCITINEAPKSTSTSTSSLTSTSTSVSSNSKEGLAPLQSFVASPDYNPAVNITQIVQVQSQIDQLFEQRYNIPYYDGLPELSKRYEPHDENALQAALNDLKTLTQWNYVVNKFDCSNMSALTQFYLANAGFKTILVVGTDAQLDEGHCWVVVLLSGPTPEAIPIECTTQGGPAIPSKVNPNVFINQGVTDTQSYNDYLTGGWAVQDIYQAAAWAEQNYGQTLGADNDFNWWDTTQVNWSMLTENVPTTTSSTLTTATVTSIQPPSVAVNPLSASTGQIVTVTGQGFTPDSIISTLGITIGGMIGNASSISVDTNGNFSYSFILSSLPNGTYTVKVTDMAGRSASATFTVTTPQTTPPPTLSLTQTSGGPGSTFTVRGYNFTPYGTVTSADILWNGVATTGSNTFNVDSTGYISFILTLSASQSPGSYTILVTDSSGKSASATFAVLPSTTTTPVTTQTTTPATLTTTPSSGSPGSTFTVNGYNFTPNGTVKSSDILWNNTPLTSGNIYNIDGTGNVSLRLTLSANQSAGSYTIVVTDSSGKSASTSFTVLAQTTTPSSVLYPANGATNVPVTGITFTWPAVSGSSVTYQFALAQASANTSANEFAILDYSDNTTTNAEPLQETLQYNTVYWWEVRAVTMNASGGIAATGQWTVSMFTTIAGGTTKTTTTITITTTPITTTTVTSAVLYPANGATNVPITGITFTWPAVSGSSVTYQFALAQASANTSANEFAILDYSDNTTTNAEPCQETLKYNTVYWWEVRAVTMNSSGGIAATGPWSIQTFTTVAAK